MKRKLIEGLKNLRGANNTAYSPETRAALEALTTARTAQRKAYKSMLSMIYDSTTQQLFAMCLEIHRLEGSIEGLDKKSYIERNLKAFDGDTKKMRIAVINDNTRLGAIINMIEEEQTDKRIIIKGRGARTDGESNGS